MIEDRDKGIGPFKAVGLLLNTVGSATKVLDTAVAGTGNAVSTGLKMTNNILTKGAAAIEITANKALEDLRADNEADTIVDNAYRKVRISQAQTQATAILTELEKSKDIST